MIRPRAVAWDIDGTLADSEGLHLRALLAISAGHGVNLSNLPHDTFRGVHMADVWSALRSRFPSGLTRGEWLGEIENYYVARASEINPMPEAVETVRELSARGILQACVSNSTRRLVDANLRALGMSDLLAFSISFDDVSAGKPDPEPFRSAARRLDIPAEAIVAVEDSRSGALSARAAGLFVVRYGPIGGVGDRWITRLSEVLQIFGG